MPVISLPDGSQKTFNEAVSVLSVAESIGAGLARAALAGRVNGQLVDLSFQITDDAELALITGSDAEGLEIIRHSTAHLLAQAVKQVFPTAQVTIGPVIENGFYYDFAFERTFTPEDMTKIEKKMAELVKAKQAVTRKEMPRNAAIEYFESLGEHYKVEVIKEIPENEVLSLYSQGDFTDLCRGPHVPNTSRLKAFKLMKIAGAYWRGDSDNVMLQRIYGTAWTSKDELKAYLHRLEEAEKRDHRKLAKKMDLFHLQEEAPGMVFWHDKGWTLNTLVRNYISERLKETGYLEVNTPILADRSLWERSGHWDKFGDEMFTTESEHREYAVKPMNCPCHVQIFNQGLKSYRDLPLKLAEFGCCHRNEFSGTLHGLMRVRGFVQDDAHIFCTDSQVQEEVLNFIDLLYDVYADFGFTEVIIKLSTRPEKRVGSDEVWDKAEAALAAALNDKGLAFDLQPGEGAFYGPKIEFSLKDCLGRVWQCGTMQVDFSMPERLGATYVDETSQRQTPVMLHRAILGSIERFIGILIEEYAGNFPLWLAPVQVVTINITDRQAKTATEITETLKKRGLRAQSDLRNEKIGFKIREHTIARVPYVVVIGDREQGSGLVSVRTQDGTDVGDMSLDAFISHLETEVANKGMGNY